MTTPTRSRTPVISGLIVAAACMLFGTAMLLAPDEFDGPTYEVMFDSAPPQVWGLLFVAAGAAYAIVRRPVWSAGMTFVMLAFALYIGVAVLQGKAGSPVGWVWPGCLAALLVVNGYRGGR